MQIKMKALLKDIIPFFSSAKNDLEEEFSKNVVTHFFKKDTFLTLEGDECNYFPIIKSGIVRVYKVGSKGQEITLYRINPGESCVLTISCLLAKNKFPAYAIVEKDCEILSVSAEKLREWMKKYDLWSEYIYNYLSKVLVNVIKIIENISFKKIDVRILEYLVGQYLQKGKQLILTHQQIAFDIGTAREVVSRSLKELESLSLISLSRGKIIINNLSELNRKLSYLQ